MKNRAGQKVSRNHKKGFTFVELLIAMVIVAIVSGAVIMLGYTYFNHFEQSTELSMARERGIMVVTYLEKRILNTGLGMPDSGTIFTEAFEGLWDAADLSAYTASRDWDAPIYMPEVKEGDVSTSNELMLAYAVQSEVHTTETGQLGPAEGTLKLSRAMDTNKIDYTTDSEENAKGWLVFPSQTMAFNITAYDPTGDVTITMVPKINGSWLIPANEQLHYVRLLRAFVGADGIFRVRDLTINDGPQPLVEGIVGCRFSYDDADGVLSVTVLARGDEKYSNYVAPATMKGWGTVSDENRHYHLTVVNKGWRVRN
ncbi:MAG: PilW family protein [Thermovirgaceae bacterium]